MKKFTLLFILLPLLNFAQIAKVEKLQEVKMPFGMYHNFWEGNNEDFIIESVVKLIKKANYSPYEKNIDPFYQNISFFDKNLSIINTIKVKQNSNKNKHLKTLKINDNKYITIISNNINRKQNNYYFFIHDFKNILNAQKKHTTIEFIDKLKHYNSHSVNNYIFQSADKSKFAIIETKAIDDDVTLFISVYDSNANLLWNKEIAAWDENKKRKDYFDFEFTDEGEVIALTLYLQWDERSKKFVSGNIMIDIHSEKNNTSIEVVYEQFNLGNSKIVNIDNEFICVGYKQSKDNKKRELEGIYSFYIDLEKENISDIKDSPFPNDMITKIKSLQSFKEVQSNSRVRIRRTLKLDDGGLIAIGEDDTYSIIYGGSDFADYMSGAIFISKIGPEGKVEWNTAIPKLQSFINNSFGKHNSFDCFLYEKSIYFIFNDHKDNIKNYDYDKVKLINRKEIKQSNVVIAKMDLKTGKYEKQALPISSKTLAPHMFTRKAYLTKNDKVIMLIEAGKKQYICQISLI